jgi:hypothetical protein
MSCVNPLNEPIYRALLNKAKALKNDNLYRSSIHLKVAENVRNSTIDLNQFVVKKPVVQTYDLDKVYDNDNKIKNKVL